jgi:hypothetical protein
LQNGYLLRNVQKKHYKQKEKEIQEWLSVTYPDIAEKARKEKAEIYWADETRIQNTSNYIKGYAPKGKTPTLPVAIKHIRINRLLAKLI